MSSKKVYEITVVTKTERLVRLPATSAEGASSEARWVSEFYTPEFLVRTTYHSEITAQESSPQDEKEEQWLVEPEKKEISETPAEHP